MGGGFGIMLGIGLGNIISFSMGGTFIIPWQFIIGGFFYVII